MVIDSVFTGVNHLGYFVTWLLRFGLTPKIPSNSTNDKIYRANCKTVPRHVTVALHLWSNSTSQELLAMKPCTAGMQRELGRSQARLVAEQIVCT